MNRWFVWLPGMSDLWRFKQMGVDNAVVNEGFNPKMALLQAMDQFYRAGMKVWRYPAVDMVPAGVPELDQHPAFAGISLKDEPVMHGMTPAAWQAQADDFLKKVGKFEIIGNLEGDKFSARLGKLGIKQQNELGAYMAACGTVLYDFYGESRVRYNPDKTFLGWYGLEAGLNSFRQMIVVNQGFDVKRRLGVVVEMSNQCIDKNSRASTRGELRGRLWAHFLLGCRDFMIFPQRPNNVKNPETGNPNWETYGSPNCAIPPELELEFMLNKEKLDEISELGPPDTKIDSEGLISNAWRSRDVIVSLDRASNNVTCTVKGAIVWERKTQSQIRPYSPVVYADQVAAQASLDTLRMGTEVIQLKNKVDKLQSKLDRIQSIFEEE